jgi:hypothetical protein
VAVKKSPEERISEALRLLESARRNEEHSPDADSIRVREACENQLNYLLDNYQGAGKRADTFV